MRTAAVVVLLLAGGLLSLLGLRYGNRAAPRRAVWAEPTDSPPPAEPSEDPLLAMLRAGDPDVRLQGALQLEALHIPALIAMLRGGPDRVLAARTLRRLKAADALDALIEVARSSEGRLQIEVVRALRELKDERAVPLFAELLTHPDDKLVEHAADALSELKENAAPAVPQMVAALEQRRKETASHVLWALRVLGPRAAPAVPSLVRALKDDFQSRAVMWAIEKIGPAAADAIPLIVKMFVDNEIAKAKYKEQHPGAYTHSTVGITGYAYSGLGGIGEPAIPVLVDLMSHENSKVRFWSGRAFEEMGDAALPALVNLCRSPNANARQEAVEVLRDFAKEHPELLGTVVRLLDDPGKGVRREAIETLGKFGAAAVPRLAALAEDPKTREDAIEALSFIGSKEAMPPLVKVCTHKEWAIRFKAVNGLGRIGPAAASAAPIVLKAGREGDGYIRRSALEALQAMGAGAVPYLARALDDPDLALRALAAEALARIKSDDPRIATGLAGLLGHPEARVAAAAALAKRGRDAKRTLPILRAALLDMDLSRRKLAADGIAGVGKHAKDAVPDLLGSLDDYWKGRMRGGYSANVEAALVAIARHHPDAVAKGLTHDNQWVRQSAGDALAKAGKQATLVLIQALTHKSPRVRHGAARALAKSPSAAPALRGALADKDPGVRLRAAQSYWEITKDPRPLVTPLIALVQAGGPETARKAGALLGGFSTLGAFALQQLRVALAESESRTSRVLLTGAIRKISEG